MLNPRQSATCALSNAAANSHQVCPQQPPLRQWPVRSRSQPPLILAASAQVALQISAAPGMIAALVDLLQCAVLQKDSGTEPADHDALRSAASAMGCMDNLSHYPEARRALEQAGVLAVLVPVVAWDSAQEGPSVMAAESLMIITRLSPPAALAALRVLPPPPPRSRTKWTRRVPHPVLIGHAASLTPY